MLSTAELLKSLHSTLNATIEHLDVVEGAEEKANNARELLAGILRDYKTTSSRLETVKAELAVVEADLANKTNLINDERARVLQDTNRQIAAKEDELKQLTARVNKATHEHDTVVARMQELVGRLSI